jgi:alginate O-acetyltransferase complex protein AlgI
MDFTSLGYYFWFLPISILLYSFAPWKNRDAKVLILVVLSYCFFWIASGWHFLLLAISTITDWFAGERIHDSGDELTRRRWLYLSIIINLGTLAVFKYLDFFIETYNIIALKLPTSPDIDTLGLALPVGISFYTFQTMSYTIDIYRKETQPYQKFVDFACYASFFPQLVAGPIVRSREFLIEIQKPSKLSSTNLRIGMTLIIYGLFKKMVVADNLAIHVNYIFDGNSPLDNTLLVWWGALCFGIQIYCDFSGYTDIALGSAALMGISLPENFMTPYSSTSPREFWRRWHISLSTWLRDYLYIPLGGSKNGPRVLTFALFGTMLLGGLWHGASWNFVIWGFVHAILLVLNRALSSSKLVSIVFKLIPKTANFISWLSTQYAIFLTWLIFRIEDLDTLLRSIKSFVLYDSHFDFNEFSSSLPSIKITTGLIVIAFLSLHFASGLAGGGKYWLSRRHPLVWGLILGLALFCCVMLRPAETVDFIYFRF